MHTRFHHINRHKHIYCETFCIHFLSLFLCINNGKKFNRRYIRFIKFFNENSIFNGFCTFQYFAHCSVNCFSLTHIQLKVYIIIIVIFFFSSMFYIHEKYYTKIRVYRAYFIMNSLIIIYINNFFSFFSLVINHIEQNEV